MGAWVGLARGACVGLVRAGCAGLAVEGAIIEKSGSTGPPHRPINHNTAFIN